MSHVVEASCVVFGDDEDVNIFFFFSAVAPLPAPPVILRDEVLPVEEIASSSTSSTMSSSVDLLADE